jgi:uncharacterized protein YfaS (alpha-2-macroglobulin family)
VKKLYILLLSGLLFSACKKEIEIPINADLPFKPYISAYTSGIISKTSSLKIHFKEAIADSLASDSTFLRSAIEVTPKFDYSVAFNARKTLEIKPINQLQPATRFKVDVNIGKLVQQDLKQPIFPMVFETITPDYTFKDLKLAPRDIYKPNDLTLTGFLHTDDVEELENVRQIITSVGKYNKGALKWTKHSDRKFEFVLGGIRKKDKATSFILKADGEPIGAKREVKEKIEVPAISDFKVMRWDYTSYPDQILTLQFSEPLLEKQELKGLIELKDIHRFTYEINATEVKLFLNNSFTGKTKLIINKGVKNFKGKSTPRTQELEIKIDKPKATVEIIGDGAILPNSQGLIVPFRTIGLKKVDLDIFRIHENNILQFLQVNELAEKDQLNRVAEKIKSTTIDLSKTNQNKLQQWTTQGINLRDIINPQPGAIYRVRFSFKQDYTFCSCSNNSNASYYSEYYDYYENSSYKNRDGYDECNNYFYYYSTKSKNLLASDLGLIVKGSRNNSYRLVSTNLVTGKAEPYTTLRFYNYAQRAIKTITTNELGFGEATFNESPFVVVASKGSHKTYLKLRQNNTNSLSKFETEGITRGDGVEAFFYGERGVWRPGDNIYLSMVLKDEFNRMRDQMPAVLTLTNPQGQLVSTHQLKLTKTGINSVTLKTEPSDPTGTYIATLNAGSRSFSKGLKIETVRPNRLKIHLTPPQPEIFGSKDQQLELKSEWLHGKAASELNASVTMRLRPQPTSFTQFKTYTFTDIGKSFESTEEVIFSGSLNEEGKSNILLKPRKLKSPGKLKADFTTKVFEKGGGFSIDNFNAIYHPYNSYIGLKVPTNSYGYLSTNTKNTIRFARVNPQGKLIKTNKTVNLRIYKIEWNWWWQHNNEDLAGYISNNSFNVIEDKQVRLQSGKGQFTFTINDYDWGQYYIQVEDPEGGHSAGVSFFADYPGSYRNEKEQHNASLLEMSLNKEKYQVGELAKLTFPSSANGKALVSLENDVEVLQTFWVNTTHNTTTIDIPLSAAMSPNCYAHVSVIQPHIHKSNDKPLRMYGVLPITVFDENTVLHPIITLKDEIRPEEKASITVSEKNNRGMYYTVAIVDEGLLDLTRFKTPRIWKNFHKKRALGIQTWDVYDDVINAFSGKFDNVYSVGGDAEGVEGNLAKANRFVPVVKYLGPFYLPPGKSDRHTFTIENYIGSVRAMVVARNGNAFGHAQEVTKVKKPLMIQSNIPRVLTPGDEFEIPVTVFANEQAKLPINIRLTTNDHLIVSKPSYKLSTIENGEGMAYFKVKISNKPGIGKLTFNASCPNDKHQEKTEIAIRIPGYPIHEVQNKILQKGESVSFPLAPLGFAGTNSASLEVSQYPAINLDKRLNYLIQYPHGCIEQTTSSVFPQLYLKQLVDLSSEQEKRIETNIDLAINRLKKFLTLDGGFAYWPGGNSSSKWGTTYAGHFLLLAKEQGYYVPNYMLTKWYNYQKRKVNEHRNTASKYNRSELDQAYRLYTLALYGKPDIGAMNRLKESGLKSNTAKWRLASAYALAGRQAIAKNLVAGVSYSVPKYRDYHYTFGSAYRDKSIILECMQLIGEEERILPLMNGIAKQLGSDNWLSTQETAYALLALATVIKDQKDTKAAFTYAINGDTKQISFTKPISQNNLGTVERKKAIRIANTGEKPLYVRVINRGTPPSTQIETKSNGLSLSTSYTTLDGKTVSEGELKQGEDYKLSVTIKNLNNTERIRNIALTTYLPSAFELQNNRLYGGKLNTNASYEDLRDDRIFTYIDLGPLEAKTFTYSITASYEGRYLHPGFYCEAMYDASIFAQVGGKYLSVE